MADERKAFLLRTDPLLWKNLESWAADELRSVNGQIEFILREAVRRRRKSDADPDIGRAAAKGPADPAAGV
jgi:hypothetical protein